jgi:hypothetical protein
VKRALDSEAQTVLTQLPVAIESGPSATEAVLDAWARRILDKVVELTPVVTGNLARGWRLVRG